jgi:hypothetical protein
MTAPTDARARLVEQVERLEVAYEAAHRRLTERAEQDPFAVMAPEEMQDGNGRYLLLDALTALVAARTVLAQQAPESPFARGGVVPPPEEKALWEGVGRLTLVGRSSEVRYVHARIIEPEPPQMPADLSFRPVWREPVDEMPRVILSAAPESAGAVDRSVPPFLPPTVSPDAPLQEWLLRANGWEFRLQLRSLEHKLDSRYRPTLWKATTDVVGSYEVLSDAPW